MSSDNIYQEVKLYLEGVQIPFTSITINQSYGGLPTASINVPPQIGLMDIARFYQPKVHIFFTERPSGEEKVLFTGIITASHYSKSKDGGGSMGVVFDCAHRYSLLTECLIDYCGFIREGDIGGSSSFYADQMNSKAAILEALNGWNEVSQDMFGDYSEQNPVGPLKNSVSRVDVLPSYLASFSGRLRGMPGVFINFWNQLKRAAYNPTLIVYQGAFKNIYEPLVEGGLQFFKRLSGHMLIEEEIDNSREPGCGDKGDKSILVPPCNKLFLTSAVQANLAVENMHSFMQNSNEITNIYQIFQTYYQTLEYDIVTLSSPAEVAKDPHNSAAGTYGVDTIVKPSLPFYFSPICNVILPSMYTSISVSYDEANMPTRLDVLNNESGNANAPHLHYRTPASVREAIATKNTPKERNLQHTLASSLGAIGKYEMGRGIKYDSLAMPNWLSILSNSMFADQGKPNNSSTIPASGTPNEQALKDLQEGWNNRYPNQPTMNPWDPASNIAPHEKILFSMADYYFTKKFASMKAGSINCLFNPYIIPGYPMDILEASPNLPSFHAMCAGVTHNITSNSISTQVNFVAAMTYTELANYYIPFINPYLQVQLGLAKNPTLVGTDNGPALQKANDFYFPTLGVNAATPEALFDFKTGMTQSVKMSEGQIVSSGKDLSEHSFEDDLAICKRPIESKADFANRFSIKYIDMTPQNYSPTGVKYVDPNLSNGNASKFEIGQSQFLDYSNEVYNIVNGVPNDK